MTFHQACKAVFVHCPDPYARRYAMAGYYLFEADAVQAQALYILNNIRHWRGPTAAQVRAELKRFAEAV